MNNNNNGGGCLTTIVVFFIIFFLPAWVTGDNFGWGVLIVWWIILAAICWVVYECSKPQPNNTKNASSGELGYGNLGLTLSKSNQNKTLTDKYNGKIELKRRLESEVRDSSDSIERVKSEIDELNKRNGKINSYAGKPLLMTKKKYLSRMLPEINANTEKIKALEETVEQLCQQVEEKKSIITTMKFVLHEESNQEFETLKKALDIFKKSKKIEGTMNIKGSEVTVFQQKSDLKFIEYKTPPYSIGLGGNRFYIFPNSVWVFEGDDKLIGIYKPRVIEAKFEHKENIKYSFKTYPDIVEDTKIVTKDIPHTTWLHTCRDGSPDMRYSHNPQRTYYTQQEYYLECKFELVLCGYIFSYSVSSYDNCEILLKAIKKYSEVEECKDVVPMLLDLLKRCTDGRDLEIISEKITSYYGG